MQELLQACHHASNRRKLINCAKLASAQPAKADRDSHAVGDATSAVAIEELAAEKAQGLPRSQICKRQLRGIQVHRLIGRTCSNDGRV